MIIGWYHEKHGLTKKEYAIFLALPTIEGLTLSAAVRLLNKEHGIAETTSKRILRGFRNSGMVNAGSKNNQNIPIKIRRWEYAKRRRP